MLSRPPRLHAAALLAALLAACAAPPPPGGSSDAATAPASAGPWVARTATGRQEVRVEPLPAPVPLNEPFELLVRVSDVTREPARPMPAVELVVTAWMPAHGHGMNRRPHVVARGDGTFLVRGMLFHMAGHWQIGIDVIDRGVAANATFDVTL